MKGYARMLRDQNDRCAICEKEFGGKPIPDHNHETGTVRGLLCRPCNTGLGLFGDSAGRLRAADAYLTERGQYGPPQ